MPKPRIAIFDFACCEGCQLQIVNLEEEIVSLISQVTPVEWREAISDSSQEYDIAIIEGSITRKEDEEKIREIRSRAKILVALGACATIGGVNKLKNNGNLDEKKQDVYGASASMPHLDTMPTKAIGEVVTVDLMIHGCPIDKKEFTYIVRCLVAGKNPVIPDYPVCVECKKMGNICRYEYKEICLGPVIRAGCGAKCPSGGFWCFGCRGFIDNPNVNAARDVMEKYGKTMKDLEQKLGLFNKVEEKVNG
jgi:sulfhydrogenase subunit delta